MRALAFTLVMMGLLPMALVSPMVGLLTWAWLSDMNPYRLTYGFAFSFHWVFIVAAVTLFSTFIHPEQRRKIPWNSVSVLLVLLLLWTGITSMTAVMGHYAFNRWIEFLKIQVLALTTLALVFDKRRLHWLLWVIVLSFGFWGLKSGLFTILKGGLYHVLGPPKSFFRDNNEFALVMCMSLPLMRYMQLQSRNKWVRRGLLALMTFTVISILGTYSRGGLLALLATLGMLLMKSRKRLGILIVVVILAPILFNFMPQRWTERMHTLSDAHQTASMQTRIQSWEFATNVALAKPITGGGFEVWDSNEAWDEYGPPGAVHRAIHSIFFEILGEHGFVGLFLFVALLAAGWRSLSKVKSLVKQDESRKWMGDLAAMLQVSLVAYVIAGAALPMPYFDFLYQVLAVTALLRAMSLGYASAAETSSEAVGKSQVVGKVHQ